MISAPVPLDEDFRVQALHRFEVLDTDPEQALDDITRLASEICGVPICVISLVDTDRQWFKSRVGIDASQTPRETAFCAHTILENQVMEIENALFDPRFVDNPLVAGAPNIRYYAGAPLRRAQGSAIGTLCVIDSIPRKLSEQQLRVLQALADQIMHRLELRASMRDLAAATVRAVELERYLKTYTARSVWQRLSAVIDGHAAGPVGEHVGQTYMFADVCGFTSLSSGADPELVARALNWYMGAAVEQIHGHGGDVEKFLGDGIFAVFDDPCAASSAALAIQLVCREQAAKAEDAGLPALEMSIGVHTGAAIRVHVGNSSRRDNTLIGEAINIAARLEGSCPPGAVLISDAAYAVASCSLAVSRSFHLSLKGIEAPVLVHQLRP